MKGINALDFRKSWLDERMKGINAPDFRKSRLDERMKGINTPDLSKSRPDEQMKGINAPDHFPDNLPPVVVIPKRCPAAACSSRVFPTVLTPFREVRTVCY
ncbi:hypothetical protein MHH28_10980 [Paenibacillus sp. FSL K6-1217]|uniref:hypothetical protein n=1 Tax=Paenibacillus sp. FSL K6-1217 TaxID=2921466 RepID=UPI00325506FA